MTGAYKTNRAAKVSKYEMKLYCITFAWAVGKTYKADINRTCSVSLEREDGGLMDGRLQRSNIFTRAVCGGMTDFPTSVVSVQSLTRTRTQKKGWRALSGRKRQRRAREIRKTEKKKTNQNANKIVTLRPLNTTVWRAYCDRLQSFWTSSRQI